MATLRAKNLALAISSCSDVCTAISDKNHPCHKVVDWQANQHKPQITEVSGSKLHRPEAWTGDLEKAKIIFLSSNPSFNSVEQFPNWNEIEWSDETISRFGAERFISFPDRGFGALDSSDSSLRDRTIGLNRELSELVKHWSWARRYAAYVLNKDISKTSAISDYVMTELVHCKSFSEVGVMQALFHCSSKWFERMMEISPAKLIFVGGKPAAIAFVEMFKEQVPSNWGPWQDLEMHGLKGVFPKSVKHLRHLIENKKWGVEEQKGNMCKVEIGGQSRLVVYIARPGGHGLTAPWNHPELVHPEILKLWRDQIS